MPLRLPMAWIRSMVACQLSSKSFLGELGDRRRSRTKSVVRERFCWTSSV